LDLHSSFPDWHLSLPDCHEWLPALPLSPSGLFFQPSFLLSRHPSILPQLSGMLSFVLSLVPFPWYDAVTTQFNVQCNNLINPIRFDSTTSDTKISHVGGYT
jgi:hypothetical protein